MKRKASFFLLYIVYFYLAEAHPLHLSTTEIRYNHQNSSFEITIKTFIEDMDLAIKTFQNIKPFLNSVKEMTDSDKYIQNYLKKHFIIWIDQTPKTYRYVGKEYENEFLWIYVEILDIEPNQPLEIQQNMLMDLYNDQNNYLYFIDNQNQQSFILNNRKTIISILW